MHLSTAPGIPEGLENYRFLDASQFQSDQVTEEQLDTACKYEKWNNKEIELIKNDEMMKAFCF